MVVIRVGLYYILYWEVVVDEVVVVVDVYIFQVIEQGGFVVLGGVFGFGYYVIFFQCRDGDEVDVVDIQFVGKFFEVLFDFFVSFF